jgi:hypothetical protein
MRHPVHVAGAHKMRAGSNQLYAVFVYSDDPSQLHHFLIMWYAGDMSAMRASVD